jgi:hypothetical protein
MQVSRTDPPPIGAFRGCSGPQRSVIAPPSAPSRSALGVGHAFTSRSSSAIASPALPAIIGEILDTFLILTIFLLPAIIGGSSTRFPASTRTSANA